MSTNEENKNDIDLDEDDDIDLNDIIHPNVTKTGDEKQDNKNEQNHHHESDEEDYLIKSNHNTVMGVASQNEKLVFKFNVQQQIQPQWTIPKKH